MSIADLLDDWFESPQVKGLMAVNGIIGTWAGPCEPGTAYVMAHHSIGDVGDGQLGSWGYPEGGMGGVAHATAMTPATVIFSGGVSMVQRGLRGVRNSRARAICRETRHDPADPARHNAGAQVLMAGLEMTTPFVSTRWSSGRTLDRATAFRGGVKSVRVPRH
jgi:hypothetical protein